MSSTVPEPERQAAEAILRADPALAGFPAPLMSLLFAVCEWRRVPAGRRLFSAGDTTGALTVVATGFVSFETAIAIPDLPLVNLIQAPIWTIGQPQVNGRMRMNTMTARTPLIIARIPQGRFEALAAQEPALHNFKAWVVITLFWAALEALTDSLIPDSRHRMISTLLRIAGRKQVGNTAITVPISQTELATLTHLSRQTCGDLLRSFERDGLIRLGYREIAVLQPQLLRSMID